MEKRQLEVIDGKMTIYVSGLIENRKKKKTKKARMVLLVHFLSLLKKIK